MVRKIATWSILIVLALNILLHAYPLFRGASYLLWRPPIRMLILADPHLEGDAKIARMGWRGSLDIWGNDHYLGHIHRSMRFFTRPTHTIILGDHMSSQWIDDAEFSKRSLRMENRILKWGPNDKVFNITGNHDIGYAGDMTEFRVNRWELHFGSTNFVSFLDAQDLPKGSPPLRIVGMNNLNVDGPALDEVLRGKTHSFLKDLPPGCEAPPSDSTKQCFPGTTILLTHVPLHKEAGLCVDAPYMGYYEGARILLREQNHLSPESTRAVLRGVIGSGEGIVLTGHDHEGCHVIHKTSMVASEYWHAERYSTHGLRDAQRRGTKAIEEVTVRSMMGQYQGNAGVLIARLDQNTRKWVFHYQAVPFVHNTVWWVVHIVSILEAFFLIALYVETRSMIGRTLFETLKRKLLITKSR